MIIKILFIKQKNSKFVYVCWMCYPNQVFRSTVAVRVLYSWYFHVYDNSQIDSQEKGIKMASLSAFKLYCTELYIV